MSDLRVFLVLPLLLALQPAVAGDKPEAPAASDVRVIRSEVADPFKVVQREGAPPTLTAEFTQQMPTPGWTFEIDSIETRGDRIVAKFTELRPQGIVAQMLAPGTMTISLGSLKPGRYVLEIRSRRDRMIDHQPTFAAVLLATP